MLHRTLQPSSPSLKDGTMRNDCRKARDISKNVFTHSRNSPAPYIKLVHNPTIYDTLCWGNFIWYLPQPNPFPQKIYISWNEGILVLYSYALAFVTASADLSKLSNVRRNRKFKATVMYLDRFFKKLLCFV